MVGGLTMRKLSFLLFCVTAWVWSVPNFAVIAQVYGQKENFEGKITSGNIDIESKLWILGVKYKLEMTKKKGSTGEIMVPERVPYLYYWLYDKHGDLINEGALGDSVNYATLIPMNDSGAVVVWRCLTSIRSLRDPTEGYVRANYITKDGVVKDNRIISHSNYFYRIKSPPPTDIIYSQLWLLDKFENKALVIQNEKIQEVKDTPFPSLLTPTKRPFNILQIINNDVFFGWARVDTASKFEYDNYLKRETWVDYILLQDKIELATYNIIGDHWIHNRYHLPTYSMRKYEEVPLFQLLNAPAVKNQPEVQSVKLKNGKIVVTIFTSENDKPVAYQMLFDTLGQYIAPEKMEVLKPKDISIIPDNSKLFIKGEPSSRDKSGKRKDTDVYIWGYDKEDGMLYWKKYHID